MLKRFVSFLRCTTDETHKPPRRKKQKRTKKKGKPDKTTDYPRADLDNPIPDVFENLYVGDPLVVQLYTQGLLVRHWTSIHQTDRPTDIRIVNNSYRLYEDEYSIEVSSDHPVINICHGFTNRDLREGFEMGLAGRIRMMEDMRAVLDGTYNDGHFCDPPRSRSSSRQAQSTTSTSEQTPRPGCSTDRAVRVTDTDEQSDRSSDRGARAATSNQQPGCSRDHAGPAVHTRTINNAVARPGSRAVALVGQMNRPRQDLPIAVRAFAGPAIPQIWPTAGQPMPIPEYAHELPAPPTVSQRPPRRNRMRLTRLRPASSLHWNVRQLIGDPLYPNYEPLPTPAVYTTVDFFRLVTYRLGEPGERERHMRRVNIPLTVPNVLPLSSIPFRGVFNRLRSTLSLARRLYVVAGERIPGLDPLSFDLGIQRRYLEAQMRIHLLPGSQDQENADN